MQLILGLCMAFFIGGATGYLGSLMLTKRMSLVGGPLGHLSLPGIALALRYNFDLFYGALLFIAVGSVAIWFIERKTHLPLEAITAVVFSVFLSISFLFLPHEHHTKALLGDISKVTLPMTLTTIALCIAIGIVTYYIAPQIILSSICPDLANTRGKTMAIVNFVYLASIAVLIALGARIVGGLMTAALVAIPACTSKNLIVANINRYTLVSLCLGALSCTIGVLITTRTPIKVGPAIVLTSGLFFAVSMMMKKA